MLECKGFLKNGITLWQEETFFLGISVPFVTSVVLRSVLYGMWFVDCSCVLPIVNSLFMLMRASYSKQFVHAHPMILRHLMDNFAEKRACTHTHTHT